MKPITLFKLFFLSSTFSLFIILSSCGESNNSEIVIEENLDEPMKINLEEEQIEEDVDNEISTIEEPTSSNTEDANITTNSSDNQPSSSEDKTTEPGNLPTPSQPDPIMDTPPADVVALATNDADKWKIPAIAKSKKNPTTSNAESLNIGKELYKKHCSSCHGKTGKGDGPKSDELDSESTDFTTAAFQKQTDGAILYKTKEGKDDMPKYKKKIPNEENLWHIVNYLRTLN